MTIQVDTREKQRAIKKILAYFDDNNIQHFPFGMVVGDYLNLDNPRFVIDRKQNLSELVNNVCQQHIRFTNELKRANKLGIKLIFLVEHGSKIKTLEDVKSWVNPRLKVSPYAVSGGQLHKILTTIEQKYNTKFYFCEKKDTGRRIVELLGGE